MEIKREKYLNDLMIRMHNGMIKVITGIVRDVIKIKRDADGITTMSIYDFLLNENSLEL